MAHHQREGTNTVSAISNNIREVDFDDNVAIVPIATWARTRRQFVKAPHIWASTVSPGESEVREAGSFLPWHHGSFFNVEIEFDSEKMGFLNRDYFLGVFGQWHREARSLFPWEHTATRLERYSTSRKRWRIVRADRYHSLATASCVSGSWQARQANVVPEDDLDLFYDVVRRWWVAHSPGWLQPEGIKFVDSMVSHKGVYNRHMSIVNSLEELVRPVDGRPDTMGCRMIWTSARLAASYRERKNFPGHQPDRCSEFPYGWELKEYLVSKGRDPNWVLTLAAL